MQARRSLSTLVGEYRYSTEASSRAALARWFLLMRLTQQRSTYPVLGALVSATCLKRLRPRGFTLLEVMIAIAILASGLLAVAAIMTRLMGGTNTSRYLSSEVTLASEKLEFLNQLQINDPI